MNPFIWTIIASFFIALISGLSGKKNGYSFWRQFITGFIAALGILSLLVKLIRDYL
ncbi:MAG: hypothetical protein R3279_04625 [Putridiphycobacter sp.]|nr:hypothetical protein [Putridiphycobacter sp.]